MVWFSAQAPGGLVINLLINLFIYFGTGSQIYTFTYYTQENSHSVEILYCYQFKTFVLTNMGDT